MHTSADAFAASLAANRNAGSRLGRSSAVGPNQSGKTGATPAGFQSQFESALAPAAASTHAAPAPAAAAGNRSAAWEDFFSHPVIGTSEDGLPIVGETEAELAKTLANYTRIAEAQGFSPQPTETVQARMPVYDGLIGPQLGYHQVTLVRLPFPLIPIASDSLPESLLSSSRT